jgi:hypothetical protein
MDLMRTVALAFLGKFDHELGDRHRQPIVPIDKIHKERARPYDRRIINAIFYVLRTTRGVSFDHLVGERKQRGRHVEAKHSSGL